MTWEQLREKHPRFCYERYTFSVTETALVCDFLFSIDGLDSFAPHWRIPLPPSLRTHWNERASRDPLLHQLVFSLGMVEAVSYWKLTCSPLMLIKPAPLLPEQIAFWKKLYFHGLGEFFYLNHIHTSLDAFVTLKAEGESPWYGGLSDLPTPASLSGSLIPIGGGKDSAVTAALLTPPDHNACFLIGSRPSAIQTAQIAGYAEEQIVIASRSLDHRMLHYNQAGYLNGHTPFSAIVAFSAVLTAYLLGKQQVLLSNESSANESTVVGSTVNHQYSKSFAFEADFAHYLREFLPCGVSYLSFLRPLSELQIARLFASLPAYHGVFRSCNRGAKTDSWCGACAKCLFVAIILSPFLSFAATEQILSRNLLDDSDLWEEFQQLTGLSQNKPFECVGSRDEVNTAICLAITRAKREGEPLPYLYRQYQQTPLYQTYCSRPNSYRAYWQTAHLLPPHLEERLRLAVARLDWD